MNDDITVVIPSSPIESHPSTAIIDECISSIREQLPDSEIILTIDGIRPEQEHHREKYMEYIEKVLWKCLHEWDNVLPLVFHTHMHQSGMMHQAMKLIKTPLLLYVEHDTPLVPDLKIDWDKCKDMIYKGKANTVRFHFEDVIPEEHKHLMLGKSGDFIKTYQWSQRPHLSSVTYYKDVMKHFPMSSRTMIEDVYHGVVWNDVKVDGMLGWNKHSLWIYAPKGGIKRSYNLDGRGSEPKYEMKFK